MNRTDPMSGVWQPNPLINITIPDYLSRPNLLVVKMDTGSMEPVIRRNAYVGLDRDDTHLRSGEIYALNVPGEGLVIKRVVRDLEKGRLVLRTDNPAHQDLSLPLENPGVTALGRAVWVIQEL
jgi:phage repressor protein C with HTH and peptisase S24 domain